MRQYKNGITAMDGIEKQQRAAKYTEYPEGFWYDGLSFFLGGNPLNQKTHTEQELTAESDD